MKLALYFVAYKAVKLLLGFLFKVKTLALAFWV